MIAPGLGKAVAVRTAPERTDLTVIHGRIRSASAPRSSAAYAGALAATDLAAPVGTALVAPALVFPAVVVSVAAVAVWRTAGLYERRFALSALDDLPRIMLGLAAGLGAAVALGGGVDLTGISWLALAAVLALPVTRGVVYRIELHARRHRRGARRRIAIVGDEPLVHEIARRIAERPELGSDLVGFLDADSGSAAPSLGPVDRLTVLAKHHAITDLVVTAPHLPVERMMHLLATCDAYGIHVYEVTGLQALRWSTSANVDQIWGIPIRRVRPQGPAAPARAVKRLLDIAVAATALVVLAPLLLLTAAAVRLEGGAGVIFRQPRVGRDGRIFSIYKFRSLRPDNAVESATTWSITGDPRVGRVGRFIRKTSIDELPQLVNVLLGEMSLVGPRPERPHFVDQYAVEVPQYAHRHRVPVGLTGYAAVHGLRGDTSIADRAIFDNIYIENWSLWLDIKIIVRTFSQVLRGRGA